MSPQADMAIGADQDDAACSEAGAHGSDIGIARDLHALCPPAAQPCQPLGVRDESKNKQVMRRPAEPCPIWGEQWGHGGAMGTGQISNS